jgi:hypothetical protein
MKIPGFESPSGQVSPDPDIDGIYRAWNIYVGAAGFKEIHVIIGPGY